MTNFFSRLFGRQPDQKPKSNDEDIDLTQFYTDSERELQLFEQMVNSSALPKRLLVIHGLGGVGKSTLLKMYALFCQNHRIPAAVMASEEALSPVDVLSEWVNDLGRDGLTFPTFQKTLNHYHSLQGKVEAEAKKSGQVTSKFTSIFGRTAAKAAIGMAASVIPIVGPLVGAVGETSAEAFIDWLHSFLSKSDLELYLDPANRLDSDFLSDLSHIAGNQRIVLMVDTYERMTTMDDWMRELARRLSKNVLLVIASRTVPNWNRAWQGWMARAEVIELKEMTPDDLRTLVQRYYAYIRGGDPDLQQVEAIVQFARGLPMVAATVVQLWVQYHLEDFQSVRPQVVADLVDRLLEGVPKEMRPAFEVAAVLRYFNAEILGILLESTNAEALYDELRRWPFIRSRREGLAVHTTMREMINEALRVRTPARFRMLHERAAAYYEAQLEKTTGEERDRCALEQLYHRVCTDEENGLRLFQATAEEYTRYGLVNRLRALLNDATTYPLERENSQLWRKYYIARLAHLEARLNNAEEVYQEIGENESVEAKLRAYALCDWGSILRRRDRLRQPGMEAEAIHLLESSLEPGSPIDLKLAMSWVYLSDIYIAKADWDNALFYLNQARGFFTERNDYLGLLAVLEYERGVYARQGNMRRIIDLDQDMWNMYVAAGQPLYLRTRVCPPWERIWAGRYFEMEQEYRTAIEIARSLQQQEYVCWKTRDLGFCLSLQEKSSEALATVEEGLTLARNYGSGSETEVFTALTIYGITCLTCGELDRAEEYLKQAIIAGQKLHAHLDKATLCLATLYEVRKQFEKAEHFYQATLAEGRQLGRNHLIAGALTGLTRVKYAQHDYAALASLWTEAEQLAQQYEYNDFLASLYLIRGHTSWDNLLPEWGNGFDTPLRCYQQALLYALRYNRFLLDEVLSGRKQGTPLQPLIVHCLSREKGGQEMLVSLKDWWLSSKNDTGKSRPDTISPLEDGISLLEAEHIARSREPGNGSLQKKVVEQINAAVGL